MGLFGRIGEVVSFFFPEVSVFFWGPLEDIGRWRFREKYSNTLSKDLFGITCLWLC